MERTTVVNCKAEDYDVYIGRPGVFGNPFKIGYHGNRKEVIDMYQRYFRTRMVTDPDFKARIEQLRGKRLGCYCKPESCHGDIIAAYLNGG